MRIEPVAYMEWAKLHQKRRINLSRSGLPDRTLADLGLDPAALKITGPNAYESRARLSQNLALVRDFMGREERLSWVEPDSGVIAFPRIETPVDGTRLSEILEESYDTTVVPGRFFEEPRHFRLGFGGPADQLAEGLKNIGKALASL